MRTSWKVASLALLLAVGVSVGLGWGNVTHVYLAKQLGVQFGPFNLNEMYGSVLPDLFNFEFKTPALATAFHTNTDLMYGMYALAPSRQAKSVFYGFFTHNNVWGADRTAHGVYPGDATGWIIQYASATVPLWNMSLAEKVAILLGTKLSQENQAKIPDLAIAMAHDLVETAVEIHVKRVDPLVGARLYYGAKLRPPQIAGIIATAMNLPKTVVEEGEEQYRQGMMQYGQMFLLPEDQLISAIAQVSAGVGHDFLKAMTGEDVVIDPADVVAFLTPMIDFVGVQDAWKTEIDATLVTVKDELVAHDVFPAVPVLAFHPGNVSIEEELAETNDPDIAPGKPIQTSLEQNYPNPFNPTTTIAFALPADQIVTLKVYNALGQEVATLVNEFKTAGRYSAVWDAKGIPSGIYFCRLQAGSVIETKKMTVLK